MGCRSCYHRKYDMQYSSHLLVKTYILILTATWGSCWQFFTAMADLTMTNSIPDPRAVHSEYYFGDCNNKQNIFYSHAHLDHLDILGKVIARGWIKVLRIPKCIILRGISYDSDFVQSTAYAFQICVPRITYCFTHRRIKLHYYELYIPLDMAGGVNWDLYFFGPPSLSW